MPKPVCVACQRFYRPHRNSVRVNEKMPIQTDERDAPRGTEAPHLWRDYKLWMADLWKCEGCGHEMVTGFGMQPVAEHYERDRYAREIEYAESRGCPVITVNDC